MPDTPYTDGYSRIDWRDPRDLAELLGDVDAEIRSIEREARRLDEVPQDHADSRNNRYTIDSESSQVGEYETGGGS